jgi:hypothetical protein
MNTDKSGFGLCSLSDETLDLDLWFCEIREEPDREIGHAKQIDALGRVDVIESFDGFHFQQDRSFDDQICDVFSDLDALIKDFESNLLLGRQSGVPQ